MSQMSMKILIVEDEQDIGQLYQMTLESMGHQVTLTRDGEEGVKKFTKVLLDEPRPYDVVVIDYFLPIKDGIWVAKQILKERSEQRIIFVTGHGPKLLSGLSEFDDQVEILVKPIPLTALVSKIERRREKEIANQLYNKLKEWDGTEGFSKPSSQLRTGEVINVFPG